jgi:type IV pilus assembly protein PilQ
LSDRFQVLMPGVDLSAVAGSWGVGTPEVDAVQISSGEIEGISVDAAPGVLCVPSLVDTGLEIACRAPPEPAPGEPPGAAVDDAVGAAEPRVSLDFRDADLRDVLRVLSEVSGLDFILQPGVSGRVSLRLREIPWDRALELVLRSQRLGHVLEAGVLRVGSAADLTNEIEERRRQEEARELSGDLVTFHRSLAYVRPEEVKEVLENRLSERGTLIADPRTGTVLVADVESRVREIETVLEVLDVPVPGVEIEARIVLATRTLTRRLGIQWGGGVGQDRTGKKFPQSFRVGADAIGGTTSSVTTGGPAGGVSAAANDAGERPGYGVNLPINGAPTGALGLALGALDGAARLDLALTAAERRGEVRILSAPRIVAQNARAATIKQGVTFPVQVVANNTVTVQFRDAVLELTVTPQVSSEGTVLLDLSVSNDALDFGQAVGGIPSILTQRATTRVRVEDGATTVLGGVFAKQESEDRGRVPGLHRIPLLGHLFRSREANHRDEELLIFLTPRIRTVESSRAASDAPPARP